MIRNIAEAKTTLAEILRLKDAKQQVVRLTVEIGMCRDAEARKFLLTAREQLLKIQAGPRQTVLRPAPPRPQQTPKAPARPAPTPKEPPRPAPASEAPAQPAPAPRPVTQPAPDSARPAQPAPAPRPVTQPAPDSARPAQPPAAPARPPAAPARPAPPADPAPKPSPRPAAKPKPAPPKASPKPPAPRPAKKVVSPGAKPKGRERAETGAFENIVPLSKNGEEEDIPVLPADRILDEEDAFPFLNLENFDKLPVLPGPPPSPPPRRVKKTSTSMAAVKAPAPKPAPKTAGPAGPGETPPPAKPRTPLPPPAPMPSPEPPDPEPAPGKDPIVAEDLGLLSIIREEIEAGDQDPSPPVEHEAPAAPRPAPEPGPEPPPKPPPEPEPDAAPPEDGSAVPDLVAPWRDRAGDDDEADRIERIVAGRIPAGRGTEIWTPSRPVPALGGDPPEASEMEAAGPARAQEEEQDEHEAGPVEEPEFDDEAWRPEDEIEGEEVFTAQARSVFDRFRAMFSRTYRNMPPWVLGRCYMEAPDKIARLVEDAAAKEEEGDSRGHREGLSRLYEETLDVKVRHGRTGRKVHQFLEAIARRCDWTVAGRPVDPSMVEEAVVLVMSFEPFLEKCLSLMRGGEGARERSPAFLHRVLLSGVPGFGAEEAGR